MRLFYKKTLILFLFVTYTFSCMAQKDYSLDECIQTALKNNIHIQEADNALEMAEEDKKTAFTKYFPSINASTIGFIANKGLMSMEMAPGMEMSLMKNGVAGGITASMPLFTGGQIINGNQLAKTGIEVKRLQRNLSVKEVWLTTEQYYWQYILIKEKLKTTYSIEQQLTTLLNDVQTAITSGITTKNDLLQVQLKQNEIQSNKLQLEKALSLTLATLTQYMGIEKDSINIHFEIGSQQPEPPKTFYCNHQEALNQTDEYALLQQNIQVNQIQYKIAIGKNMPTIAIGGGYAYHNFLDKDTPFWTGFASINIPITGWWSGTHDIRKQKINLKNAENQLSNQSQLLLLRMKKNWDELNNAYQQILIARKSIEQAQENLRLNKDFYATGTCTMSDLLEAETLFQQSKDKYAESYIQYELKKREYLQTTGR